MKRPNYSLELTLKGIVAGVDEAGCGPWAGPVVAAAVILDANRLPRRIDDSKQMDGELRESVYAIICQKAMFGVGIATAAEVDVLNILEAGKLAMCRAIEALPMKPDIALIDGNRPPSLPCEVRAIIGGDGESLSIAAASIIAKVTRDRIMTRLAGEFPGYGWERNAGYGTKEHQEAMVNLGITPYHRRSFAPVRAFIEATELLYVA